MASRCKDLVSYNEKHNEANGEENRDGTDNNRSWNCGVEGPTDDPGINWRYETPTKAKFLATFFCRRACPCCSPATQWATRNKGNNNAYCQDNEISWINWDDGARNIGFAGLRATGHRAAQESSGLSPQEIFSGTRDQGRRH